MGKCNVVLSGRVGVRRCEMKLIGLILVRGVWVGVFPLGDLLSLGKYSETSGRPLLPPVEQIDLAYSGQMSTIYTQHCYPVFPISPVD